MRNIFYRVANLAAALIITVASSAAVTPITVQGSIKAPGGSPVTGSHSIVFRIYDSATAGTQLWTETHPAVAFNNGIYSAVLGNTTSLEGVFSAGLQRWLSVSLDAGTEFNPRQQITATAYANYANQAGRGPIVYAGSVTTNGSNYFVPINGGESNPLASRVETPAIRDMTITQLMLSMSGTSQSYTLTLYKNGVPTSLSATIPDAPFRTGSVSVSLGDRLCFKIDNSSSNGISYSMLAE